MTKSELGQIIYRAFKAKLGYTIMGCIPEVQEKIRRRVLSKYKIKVFVTIVWYEQTRTLICTITSARTGKRESYKIVLQ